MISLWRQTGYLVPMQMGMEIDQGIGITIKGDLFICPEIPVLYVYHCVKMSVLNSKAGII